MEICRLCLNSSRQGFISPTDLQIDSQIYNGLTDLYWKCFQSSGTLLSYPGCLYVLFMDNVLVSSLAIRFGKRKLIYNVCTDPAYRRRGLMQHLFKVLIEDVNAPMYLQVEAENWNAYTLYWKLGFNPIERHEDIITMKFV